MSALENGIQRRIVARLKARGGYPIVHHGGYGVVGVADVSCPYRGRALIIEIKAEGKHPTRKQQYELDKAAAAGAYTCVARSVTDIDALLDRVDRDLGHPALTSKAA